MENEKFWERVLTEASASVSFSGFQLMAVANGRTELTGTIGVHTNIPTQLDLMRDMGTKEISLIISSQGGEMSAGIEVIRAINDCRKVGIKVNGIVRGQAMSMAFQILQECDYRAMGPADLLMAHGLTAGMMGDIRSLEAERKILDCWKNYMVGRVQARIASAKPDSVAATEEYWAKIKDDNTPVYFLADEALELGLVDAVEEDAPWPFAV